MDYVTFELLFKIWAGLACLFSIIAHRETAQFPTFFRISSFVFSRTKTFIQVWNYFRVSKW